MDEKELMLRALRLGGAWHAAFDASGNCIFSTFPADADATAVFAALRQRTARILSQAQKLAADAGHSLLLHANGVRYTVQTQVTVTSEETILICRIQRSALQPAYARYGISAMDAVQAECSINARFCGSARLRANLRALILQSAHTAAKQHPACTMIIGARGTGKDHAAQLLYAESPRASHPFYLVNCALLNEKGWAFLLNNPGSPLSETGSTIYISNLNALEQPRQKQLLSLIAESRLHERNTLLFSCGVQKQGDIPHVAMEYANMLGCRLVLLPTLCGARSLISQEAQLYAEALHTEIESAALKLLCTYRWPSNQTQLRRVMRAAASAEGKKITAETIRRILMQEELFSGQISGMTAAEETETSSQEEKPLSDRFSGSAAANPAKYDHPCTAEPHNAARAQLLAGLDQTLPLEKTLEEINRDIVRHVLNECGGNRSLAARRLGISRTTLWRYLRM